MNLINEQKPLSEEKRISVLDFYRGKKVFVTGGTGFLGKVIIEKLLRQLEVETIYILVREKKGKSIHSRIDEMTDDIVSIKTKWPPCIYTKSNIFIVLRRFKEVRSEIQA